MVFGQCIVPMGQTPSSQFSGDLIKGVDEEKNYAIYKYLDHKAGGDQIGLTQSDENAVNRHFFGIQKNNGKN